MMHPRSRDRRAPSGHAFHEEAIGLSLAAGLAAWILLAATRAGGSAGGPMALLAATALAYGVARLLATRWMAAPFVAIVAGSAIIAVLSWSDLTSDNPLAGPLGYQNANGAFFVQALVAAMILGSTSTSWVTRAMAAGAAVIFAAVPFVTGSTAAAASALAVLVIGSLAIIGWWRSWMVIALVAGLLAILLATMLLGASYAPRREASAGFVEESLTETRFALWHDALELTSRHPGTGVGVGRFAVASPVAAADPDRRHAHQEYLEMAAETGVIGGLLLVALVSWAVVRTGLRGGIGATLAAAGVTVLGIHACVDYILHFPIVPITSAVLAGAVTAEGRSATSDRDDPSVRSNRSP
jgi:O-antigen ligase